MTLPARITDTNREHQGYERPLGAGRRESRTGSLRSYATRSSAHSVHWETGVLKRQAEQNPTAFLEFVAQCLPKDMHVDTSGPSEFRWAGGDDT